jgi:hypothetical protein
MEAHKPDFYIVSAPRYGTTSMAAYLMQHPEFFLPNRKEPHYFATDLESPWFMRGDESENISLFSEAGPGQKMGEASTWYLFPQLTASEIKLFSPNAKLSSWFETRGT